MLQVDSAGWPREGSVRRWLPTGKGWEPGWGLLKPGHWAGCTGQGEGATAEREKLGLGGGGCSLRARLVRSPCLLTR